MTAPETPGREQEIRARAEALEADRVFPGSTWTASAANEKSTLPPENAWVVEDVLKRDTVEIRGSVGIFGSQQHAGFAAHAREDIPWLLDRVAELEKENAGLNDLRLRAFDKNDQLRADRDAAVAAAVRRALEDVAVAVDVKLTAEPSHMRASAFYEVLLLLRGMFPCTCARSGGMHEKTCLRYVEGHELLSPENALAAYRSAAVASPAREQGEEVTR